MNYSFSTRLDHDVAIVTSGASGMAFERAKALEECGAQVVMIDVDEQEGEEPAATFGVEFKLAKVIPLAQVRKAAARAKSARPTGTQSSN